MKTVYIFLAIILIIGSTQGMGITTALNRTVTTTPGIVYFVGNATYNQTVTLPDAATVGWKGYMIPFIVVVDPGANYFRINATGGDDISGNNCYVTTDAVASLILTSDGTNYRVIGTPLGTWNSHA